MVFTRRLGFFFLNVALLLTVVIISELDAAGSSRSDGNNNQDNEDEDEYIEPSSIKYDQFARAADKEADFKTTPPACGDLYEAIVQKADGTELALEKFRGKITLVVNIPSPAGMASNTYHDLVYLNSMFFPTGLFNVLAFPCFEFTDNLAPSSADSIQRFLRDNYGVNFPIMDTVHCSGEKAIDVFRFLSYEARSKLPNWNFWKFLVGPDGHLLLVLSPGQPASALFERVKKEIEHIQTGIKDEL